MHTAVILAAGRGSRVWPYGEVRPKAMIPAANKPLVAHQVDALKGLGITKIRIAGSHQVEQIRNHFRLDESVEVVDVGDTKGTAFSLAALRPHLEAEPVVVLYGDTLLEPSDLERLITKESSPDMVRALTVPLNEELSGDWVCCAVTGDQVTQIKGHPRGGSDYRFGGFVLPPSFWPYLKNNGGVFSSIEVGMMPPVEGYLEMSLQDWLSDGHQVEAVTAEGPFVDVDKPWHILQANHIAARRAAGALTENVLGDGTSIHPTAIIEGNVELGDHSRIGPNVIIKGNVVVGEHSTIDSGAIVGGNTIIGDHSYVGNYCYVSDGAVVGNHCVVSHCAELDGMIMDYVYLYHYMEFSGIIGLNTDLGAATVCGTLRFDDFITSHKVKGRREYPRHFANATYFGDYCRTGVNSIIMPGCKIGVYSVVGPGVILKEDLPNNTIVQVAQQLEYGEWGPNRYGW